MAFFGITCLGYQEPFKPRTLQSWGGVSYYRGDEKREGSDSKLPPIHRTSSTALHKGSQERYKEMIKRVQMPNCKYNELNRTDTGFICTAWPLY
ncbi:UNVERIFIED_CONTAM: hypothetical protein FKN15_006459 [Acipenser sinensis]